MKRIYAQNEPQGEGSGWDDCDRDQATIWVVHDRDDPNAYWDAAFDTYAQALDYLQGNP